MVVTYFFLKTWKNHELFSENDGNRLHGVFVRRIPNPDLQPSLFHRRPAATSFSSSDSFNRVMIGSISGAEPDFFPPSDGALAPPNVNPFVMRSRGATNHASSASVTNRPQIGICYLPFHYFL